MVLIVRNKSSGVIYGDFNFWRQTVGFTVIYGVKTSGITDSHFQEHSSAAFSPLGCSSRVCVCVCMCVRVRACACACGYVT